MEGRIFISDRESNRLFTDRINIKSDGRVRIIELDEYIKGRIKILARSDNIDNLVCVIVERKFLRTAFRLKAIKPGLERRITGQDFHSGRFVPWVCAFTSFDQETSLKKKMEKAITGID